MAVALTSDSLIGSATKSRAFEYGEYRADIDGLRAIAILGVVVYHAAPGRLPGGFTGVDVFFVISGYLISGIIFRAIDSGRFSCLGFYARRVRRIFPALLITLLTVWALAWPLLLPDEYVLLGKHILGGAGFALNLVLYRDFDVYFGLTTAPLIHLWSLGVEEQFYILWPLLLITLSRWRPARFAAIIVVATLSFAMNVALLSHDRTASFYLPTCRVWELAMGSLLALVTTPAMFPERAPTLSQRHLRSRLQQLVVHATAAVGALLVAASFTRLNSYLAFPGWWALLPCLGAALIIAAGPTSWFNRYILAAPPMVFLGLISYPLYLWHWPLLSLMHIAYGDPLSPAATVGTVLVALTLATITYKYVELPIRSAPVKALTVSSLGAAMVVCAAIGALLYSGNLRPRSDSYHLEAYIRASGEDWLTAAEGDWTWYPDKLLELGNGRRAVLFVGDSNMQQYYPRIARLLGEHATNEHSAVFAVKAGCAPVLIDLLPIDSYSASACRSFMKRAIDYAKRPEVDRVVIATYWHLYLSTNFRDFGKSSIRRAADASLEALRTVIADLVARGKRVYIVLQMPTGPDFDPRQMIHRSLSTPAFVVQIRAPSRGDVERVLGPIDQKLRGVARDAGAAVIDPLPSLCNEEVCPATTTTGEPMYRDFAHLRPSYVRDHVFFLDSTLLDVDARPGS
ncbi:MAG TPA: acyltransferase family protein [Steroidobacteraceae bacterium]